ncbi:hypothetical protein PENSPDRAFT_694653 [Peniophora sp. CONT]|nr:hypothetical protein PENSPDRAFT_694653 [Peniophora sp. CONT]
MGRSRSHSPPISASDIARAELLLKKVGRKVSSSTSKSAKNKDVVHTAKARNTSSASGKQMRHTVPWAEKKHRTLTDKILRRLKEKPHYCTAFGLDKGPGKTASSGGKGKQDFGEAMAPHIFLRRSKFAEWPLEKQGNAIVARIDSLKKKYATLHEELGTTGSGLVEQDREGELEGPLANQWEKIARNFPWYKDMSMLMRRSPSLKTKAVTNSQSPVKTSGIRNMKGRTDISISSSSSSDEDDDDPEPHSDAESIESLPANISKPAPSRKKRHSPRATSIEHRSRSRSRPHSRSRSHSRRHSTMGVHKPSHSHSRSHSHSHTRSRSRSRSQFRSPSRPRQLSQEPPRNMSPSAISARMDSPFHTGSAVPFGDSSPARFDNPSPLGTPTRKRARSRNHGPESGRDQSPRSRTPQLYSSPINSPRRPRSSTGAASSGRPRSNRTDSQPRQPTPAPNPPAAPKRKGMAADLHEVITEVNQGRVQTTRIRTEIKEKNKYDMQQSRLQFEASEGQKQRDFQLQLMDRQIALANAQNRAHQAPPPPDRYDYQAPAPLAPPPARYDYQAPTAPFPFPVLDPELTKQL